MEEWLEDYEVPEWARSLAVQPTCRTKFTMKPTPIHRWHLPDLPQEFEVSAKRDDLTGSMLSGNKIRKLDFLFGDALAKGCDCVVTLGGIGSNHARATALAAQQLGLPSHLFLILKTDEIESIANATTVATGDADIAWEVKGRSEGHKPYVIPPGGSSAIGTWGYIDAWREMMDQGVLEKFDDVVTAAGTTGCLSAVAIANHLTGAKLRVHGVTIAMPSDECYKEIQKHLDELKVPADCRDIAHMIDGYVGEGYGKCTDDDLRLIMKIMSHTGVSLDPDFTMKAVKGMLTEMRERPHIFKGRRILFLHSGGIFGLYDGRIEGIVASSTAGNIHKASDIIPL